MDRQENSDVGNVSVQAKLTEQKMTMDWCSSESGPENLKSSFARSSSSFLDGNCAQL